MGLGIGGGGGQGGGGRMGRMKDWIVDRMVKKGQRCLGCWRVENRDRFC